MSTASAETQVEKRAWDLLTKDFRWEPPSQMRVKVKAKPKGAGGPSKLQIFEVAVAAIFARLRPDYEWEVTPNVPDGGSDFIGRQPFLDDEALGIDAAITIGGQCKKRTRVGDVVDEVAGSLINMADTLGPTFFVVALSAQLSEARVTRARERLERMLQRHCHILDRPQLEYLLSGHPIVVGEILDAGLSPQEAGEVREYLGSPEAQTARSPVVATPSHVLAGVPFRVVVEFPLPGAAPVEAEVRLRWKARERDGESVRVTPIGPLGLDTSQGAAVAIDGENGSSPVEGRCELELITYSAGELDLGSIRVEVGEGSNAPAGEWTSLGTVRVIENLRPRFYERPFRAALARLDHEHERALGGGVASIGVVGAGGSGKSRLCEEFGLRQRRQGRAVVAAKQAKTLDDPHRILADLLLGLASDAPALEDPAQRVVQAVALYDKALAERAGPSIRAIFGSDESETAETSEQQMLSALLLLVAARARRAPLIIHLQDMHWCSADVLLLLERLIWQLERLFPAAGAQGRAPHSGAMFLLEGRVRERQRLDEDGWDSGPFEAFLQKLNCPIVICSFDRDQGREFVQRLFEDRHSANRRIAEGLLDVQRQLIQRIDRAAGGNPFHSLEQVQLLKEKNVLGQNPVTGLLYMVQPAPSETQLPTSVFDAIRLRWIYLRSRMPELALLLWAAALLEDRIPTPLFRRLWTELAPDISLVDVDATELLWTGGCEETEVGFRHENYFRAVRKFEVSVEQRRCAVEVYCGWFGEAERVGRPVERYKWALALLQLPSPDVTEAESLMREAMRDARRQGDTRLARRIAASALDLAWSGDGSSTPAGELLLRRCEEELTLSSDLLGSNRSDAARRVERTRERLDETLTAGWAGSEETLRGLRRARVALDVRQSQIFFNDRRPAAAADLAADAVRDIDAIAMGDGLDGDVWERLRMEALHSEAVALAISGEIERSLRTSAKAVEIARSSPSSLSQHVISTYANILISRDPAESESILRRCLAELDEDAEADSGEALNGAKLNLGIALVVRAHRGDAGAGREPADLLKEARGAFTEVFAGCFQLGQYPDAAAAALMLGVVSAMREERDEVSWFAQAVAAAARGRQMETLWRAHIDLATAMHRDGEPVGGGVRDHALAAVEILEETLAPYPEPDRSARFELVRVPLAQAARFMLEAGEREGEALLERHPALRADVGDPVSSGHRDGDTSWHHEWWLPIAGEPYFLY